MPSSNWKEILQSCSCLEYKSGWMLQAKEGRMKYCSGNEMLGWRRKNIALSFRCCVRFGARHSQKESRRQRRAGKRQQHKTKQEGQQEQRTSWHKKKTTQQEQRYSGKETSVFSPCSCVCYGVEDGDDILEKNNFFLTHVMRSIEGTMSEMINARCPLHTYKLTRLQLNRHPGE